MNQLLRLPLLKYTHTEKKKQHMLKKTKQNKTKTNKKKSSTILPPQEKRGPLQHPRRRSLQRQSRNRSRQLLSQGPPPQGL